MQTWQYVTVDMHSYIHFLLVFNVFDIDGSQKAPSLLPALVLMLKYPNINLQRFAAGELEALFNKGMLHHQF